jgi:hypothetical protein
MFVSRKRRRRLTELLNEHADRLTSGAESEQELLAQHPEETDVLAGLVSLSRRLYETLVPVEPSSQFVSNLKTAITDETDAQASMVERWRTRRVRLAQHSSMLGRVVSVVAVIALVTRLVASIVMIVALLVSRRRHPAAA